MSILRHLFGNLASGVVRLAILAGLLIAGYLLIAKPAIDKTDRAIHSSGLERIGNSLESVAPRIERQVKRAFDLTKAKGGDPQRLVRCVKHADQDVKKLERCTRRF
jgi:hypothetical protein